MHILRRNKWLKILFAGPAFLIFTYFIIIATGQTIYYSFTKWKGLGSPTFQGIANYQKLFEMEDFYMVMRNNIVGLVLALIIQLGLGLIFAYLIYRTVRGMRIFRSLSFVPVVMSGAAVALMFSLIFDGNLGPLNQVLKSVGLERWARNWLSDPEVIFYAILFPMIYQYIGQYIIIMLAGMQSIPEEIIESAQIDGANSFKVFTKIVIPSQVDIILMCAIMITSGSFKAFEHSYIMTGGYSLRGAFLGVYMYVTTFQSNNFGRGSALAIIILLCSLFFTKILQRVARRFEY
jgi:raffinose/stachyose/melibiose transport system permease protein